MNCQSQFNRSYHPLRHNPQVASAEECTKKFSKEALKEAGLPSNALRERGKKFPRNFTKEISCAENTFNFENACEGDSGSPIIR